jgi:putative oxidoreductase
MAKKKASKIEFLIRLVLGITFIAASIHKIMDPAGFAKIIYGYALFPDFSINLLASMVPFIELIAGTSIIVGVYQRSALILINLLLSGFIIIIGFNLFRGHQFDCGCFSFSGTNSMASASFLLIRNVLLLIVGLFLYYKQAKVHKIIFKIS